MYSSTNTWSSEVITFPIDDSNSSFLFIISIPIPLPSLAGFMIRGYDSLSICLNISSLSNL